MNIHHILSALYEPSLITPGAHASIRRLIESRLGQEAFEAADAQRQGTDFCGNTVDLPSMAVIEGIAHIPIGGAIGHKLGLREKGRGAVDTTDVMNELAQADADPAVTAAVLDMDTPGGMVTGTPELAAAVAAFSKPILAFTSSMIASAGYWIAASADGIFTTQTASTGSIGVYVPWIDQTEAMKAEGLKVELIKAGKLKGLGFPGTALTDAQREHLQEQVDNIYGMFKSHVIEHRGNVPDSAMQGQTFMAREAMAAGLIDGIVSSKADMISKYLRNE